MDERKAKSIWGISPDYATLMNYVLENKEDYQNGSLSGSEQERFEAALYLIESNCGNSNSDEEDYDPASIGQIFQPKAPKMTVVKGNSTDDERLTFAKSKAAAYGLSEPQKKDVEAFEMALPGCCDPQGGCDDILREMIFRTCLNPATIDTSKTKIIITHNNKTVEAEKTGTPFVINEQTSKIYWDPQTTEDDLIDYITKYESISRDAYQENKFHTALFILSQKGLAQSEDDLLKSQQITNGNQYSYDDDEDDDTMSEVIKEKNLAFAITKHPYNSLKILVLVNTLEDYENNVRTDGDPEQNIINYMEKHGYSYKGSWAFEGKGTNQEIALMKMGLQYRQGIENL